MKEIVIGRCSLCDGDVVMPTAWHSIVRPKAACRICGATEAGDVRPVIEMKNPSFYSAIEQPFERENP